MLGTDKGAFQTVSSTQPDLHQRCSSSESRFKTVAKTNVYLVVSGDENLFLKGCHKHSIIISYYIPLVNIRG